MSIHTYTRALVGGDWNTSIPLLAQETQGFLPGKAFTLRADGTVVTFDFVDALTAGEIVTLTATVAANQAAGPYSRAPRPRQTIRLRSPNGNKWRISVNNAGVLQVNSVP